MTKRFSFAEERAPCGEPGLIWVGGSAPFDPRRSVDLSDCLASRPEPWILVIWEPLPTRAPKPPKAAPHCCYRNTVIFYCAPYYPRAWSKRWRDGTGRLHSETPGSLEEWDKVEDRFLWDDVVEFQGERFVIGGGTVLWARGRWWMRRGARRQAQAEAA